MTAQRPLRIIIADDHQILRETMAQTVSHLFPKAIIHQACGKQEAIALLKKQADEKQPIHFVLTDCNMEHDNAGIELLGHIKENYSQITTALMSSENHEKEAIKNGAIAFFEKPVAFEKIKEAIEHAAKKQRGQ